jgi:hypothetical protein
VVAITAKFGGKVDCVTGNRNSDDRDESRRILDRIQRESDPSGQITPARRQREDDPIEYWGTRIGRVLGWAITLALVIWFAFTIARRL